MTDFPLPARLAPPAASRRWIVLLALSILMHVLVLGWGSDSLRFPTPHAAPQPLLDATLLAPAPPLPTPPAPAVPHAAAPPHLLRRPPAARPRMPAPTATAMTPEPATPAPAVVPDSAYQVPDGPLPSIPMVNVGIGNGGGSATDSPASITGKMPAGPQYQVNPPPSAALQYDVEAWREGQRV
ncbi:MAG TPA: hypothetical protein VL051_04825, partial [Burkholderiaceae bacterium]|nr:hypothetical protein [Burkholderiaceae bacterium]